MSERVSSHVVRGAPISITINGAQVTAYEGESLATALIAADVLTMSRDSFGRARSPFCNMGVCFDCLVEVSDATGRSSRVRACMTEVCAGLRITEGTLSVIEKAWERLA